MTLFNINHEVRIKLNDLGRKIHADRSKRLGLQPPQIGEDKDGWSTWQLWQVMSLFGPHLANGAPLPFQTTIEILQRKKERE